MKQKFLVLLGALSILGILSALFLTAFSSHPLHNLAPRFDDHQSHWSTVPLFFEYGYGIYSRPTGEFCDSVNQGICQWQGTPIPINWLHMPRPYPFLNYFVHAPIGLGYRAGILSASAANLSSVLLYLSIFLVLWICTLRVARESLQRNTGLTFAFLALFYFEGLKYTWYGFYDGIGVLALAGALWAGFTKKRYDLALFAFGAAVALHFRAWWYFPLATFWGLLWLKEMNRAFDPKRALTGAIGVLLAGASAVSLWLILPSTATMDLFNRFHYSVVTQSAVGWIFLSSGVIGVIALVRTQQWELVFAFVGVVIFSIATRHTMFWHTLFIFPLFWIWFLTPASRSPRVRMITGVALLAFYLLLARFEFGARPWSLKSFAKEVVQLTAHPSTHQ